MTKEFIKDSCKLTIKIGLACMATISILLTNNDIANGVEVNKTSFSISSDSLNTINKDKFLVDAPIKFYNDLSKVEQILDFKFKVPDFLPDKCKLIGYEVRKVSDKDNALVILFENSGERFSVIISKCDPVEVLMIKEDENTKAIENTKIESEKQPLKLNNINGLDITLSTILPTRETEAGNAKESKKISKYYIWKDNGISYGLEYNSILKSKENSNVMVNMSQENIVKIVKSLKYKNEVKDVNYSIQKDPSGGIPAINIYDKDDLEKIKPLLGVNPKFPMNINKDIVITSSILGISEDSDLKNNKINYELNNFYTNKNGTITFNVQKNSKVYDNIEKSGIIDEENSTDNKNKSIKVDKLNINNLNVFKYSGKGLVSQINYIWKENNVYYSVIFFINTENSDDIVKEFINSKPVS